MNTTETQSGSSLQRMVRRWWVIECQEEDGLHEIGPHHDTLEKAEWFLAKCLSKDRRRKHCIIVRHEETAVAEAPNGWRELPPPTNQKGQDGN